MHNAGTGVPCAGVLLLGKCSVLHYVGQSSGVWVPMSECKEGYRPNSVRYTVVVCHIKLHQAASAALWHASNLMKSHSAEWHSEMNVRPR